MKGRGLVHSSWQDARGAPKCHWVGEGRENKLQIARETRWLVASLMQRSLSTPFCESEEIGFCLLCNISYYTHTLVNQCGLFS